MSKMMLLWVMYLSATAQAQMIDADLIPPPATTPHENAQGDKPAYTHPTLPADAAWPGAMLAVVLGMFAAAAGVGIVVKLEAPEEPAAHHHDDPAGLVHPH